MHVVVVACWSGKTNVCPHSLSTAIPHTVLFRRSRRQEIRQIQHTQCAFSRGFVFFKVMRTNTTRTTSNTVQNTRLFPDPGRSEGFVWTNNEQRSRPRRNTCARSNTQPIVTKGCLRLAVAIPVALRTPRSRDFASLHVSTPTRGALARVLVTQSRSDEWQWPP